MRPEFTADQQRELRRLGLFDEQVRRLQTHALPSIFWRWARPPRMHDVRAKLADLAKAHGRVESLYRRMSKSQGASAEAMTRLYLAQEALQLGLDELPKSLETASSIVHRARKDLPKAGRSTRRNTAEFVRLTRYALRLGHTEHFAKENKAAPCFPVEVTRKKPAFPRIVEIVSEASGGWSADDAIRSYLTAQGGKLAPKKS